MFCGMNFTTTGIEFGRSERSVLRVEYCKPLTVSLPWLEKQPASRGPLSASKATQTGKGVLLVPPPLGQKRASQQSSRKQKKARKGTSVEDRESSSSSSSTSSSLSLSLSSLPSVTDLDRRPAEPLKGKKWSNANVHSRPSLSSSSSLRDSSHFRNVEKNNDTSQVAAAGQPTSKKLKSFKSHERPNGTYPVNKEAIKVLPEKRVRFNMDVQARVILPVRGPSSETSSSDDSDCSYIDPPPATEPEGVISGHIDLSTGSGSHRYRPASMPIRHQPAKRIANKQASGLTLRSKGRLATSKLPSTIRPPEPVVVICSDLNKSIGKEPSHQRPAVVKSALKKSFVGKRYTASNDDKENALQYDEQLGLTFRDV